jgi:hypothetical protein
LYSTKIIVGGLADDRKGFGNIFWQRLSQRYRHLRRNTNPTDFIFDIADIRKDTTKGGPGIQVFDEPAIEERPQEMEYEGLIKLIPGKRQFRLTQKGIISVINL